MAGDVVERLTCEFDDGEYRLTWSDGHWLTAQPDGTVVWGRSPWSAEKQPQKARLTELEAGPSAGERIADAVLAWMVKYDLLDAGNEYDAPDVLAVLDDLAPAPEAKAGHAGGGVVEALRLLTERVHTFGTFHLDGDDDPMVMWDKIVVPALVAARAALAPSPSAGEPVAWRLVDEDGDHWWGPSASKEEADEAFARNADLTLQPLYATPPATPVQPTASVEKVIDQASRMMAAGWRGNPNMSGDDRDFMTPSMRRRHDDKVRQVVEFVIASLTPAPPQGDGGEHTTLQFLDGETVTARVLYEREPTPSPAPVSAPATEGEVDFPAYGEMSFDELGSAVMAATIYAEPKPFNFSPDFDKGHQIVGTINFNSLNRIVTWFVKRALALSNPAPGHGEAGAVAWRWRNRTGRDERGWVLTDSAQFAEGLAKDRFQVQALGVIAHPTTGEKPAPATGEE